MGFFKKIFGQGKPQVQDKLFQGLAFILLREPKQPSASDLEAAFAEFKAEGTPVPEISCGSEEAEGPFFVSMSFPDESFVSAILIEHPVPDSEADHQYRNSLEGLASEEPLAPHSAHFVILFQHPSCTNRLSAVETFTAILAATLKATNGVGVYWGTVGATFSAQAFLSSAMEQDPASKALIWAGMQVSTDETHPNVVIVSTGMEQLGLMNLMLQAKKEEFGSAIEYAFDLLAYMIGLGHPIGEHETIGRTPDEKRKVMYARSPLDKSTKVMFVDLV